MADAAGRTRLARLRHAGSAKLVLPRTFAPHVEGILVNTAGGITGGDQFDIAADVGEGATLTLTTQAAERAYRAQAGETGKVVTRLHVRRGGRLNWVPQELILFERCALHRRLEISLEQGAALLMVEPLVLGRVAMDEVLHSVRFRDRIRVQRDDRPLYQDGMDLEGDVASHLSQKATADDARAMASLVLICPDAAAQIDPIRRLLPQRAGASMLADDVLVMRMLAPDAFALRRSLIPILDRLTHNTLPTSWRL